MKKQYGRVDTIQDEAQPLRFYAVRHWADVDAAERCHADPDVQAITARLYQIARVTHVVNGARRPEASASASVRPVRIEGDRRAGFERRRTSGRSEEHTSELQSLRHLVCRLLLEKKKQ